MRDYREDHLGAPELSLEGLVHDLIAAVDLVDKLLLTGEFEGVSKGQRVPVFALHTLLSLFLFQAPSSTAIQEGGQFHPAPLPPI